MIQRLTLSGKPSRRRHERSIRRRLSSEQLETRTLLAGDLMQNPASVTDVNADGMTTPIDALFILNELNSGGARSLVAGEDPSSAVFYDVNGDSFLSPMDALVVLNKLNAEGEDDLLVQIRLEVSDLEDNVIENIDTGSDFVLKGYVRDLSDRGEGVFAGYLDVNYSSELVVANGEILHGDSYGNGPSGDLSQAGLIDEVGSFDGFVPLGPEEQLLFSLTMAAQNSGTVTFAPSSADESPLHDVLLFGSNDAVTAEQIMFVGTSLQIGSTDVPVAEDNQYNALMDTELIVDAANGVLSNDTDPSGGTLAASLVSDVANGQLALAADGSFSYTPNPEFVGTDSFTYIASNVGASSNVATVEITVERVNRPPVAVNDEYVTAQGTALDQVVGVLENDSDPDGDDLTARIVVEPTNGTVALNSDGSFVYTPNADFAGTDSFQYVANDGELDSNQATAAITVERVNQAPVAVADQYVTDEDTELNQVVGVLENDFDPDGDDLTARVVVEPAHGTVGLNSDGSFVYTPNAEFSGTDTFQYVANDGELDSNQATATIEVRPINDRPVANPDSYSTLQDVELSINAADGVLSNDVDIEGEGLTAAIVTTTSHGALQLADDGSFTYLPDTEFTGVDSFTYSAVDAGGLASSPATVTIDVLPDAFVRFRLETTNAAGEPIDTIAAGGEFLLKAYVEDVSSATPDGVFAAYMDVEYTSNASTNGEPVFNSEIYPNGQTYGLESSLVDEIGAFDGFEPVGAGEIWFFTIPFVAGNEGAVVFESSAADQLPSHDVLLFNRDNAVPADLIEFGTASLAIEASEPPVAFDDAYEGREDETLSVSQEDGVLANDVDPDDDALTAVLVDSTTNGSLTLNLDGSFEYMPNEHYFGVDNFSYQASDGANLSNVANVTITVLPVDDRPIAVNDSYDMDDEGQLVVSASEGVLANDQEIEGDPMTAVLVETTQNGDLELADDGSFVYTPVQGFIGRDTFTYQAQAGDLLSNIATVTINVGGVIAPSSISGLVYFDVNNDGVAGNVEDRIANVEVMLRGTDLFGDEVFETTTTGTDGTYRFDGILKGDYVLTEFQPQFTIDGKDTVGGVEASANDRFVIDLPGGVELSGFNFGERGLEPAFIGNPLFFASRNPEGLWTHLDGNGQSHWYDADDGWDDFDAISVDLNGSLTSATVTAQAGGFVSTSQIEIRGNHEVHLVGDASGYILQLEGGPEAHGIERPLAAAAVDAAFSDEN